MYINGITDGYRYDFMNIKAGETKTIPLILFEKRNGERFQPSQRAPREVIVHVTGRDAEILGF